MKVRIVIYYTSVVLLLLITNILSAPVTIEKEEVLAVEKCL